MAGIFTKPKFTFNSETFLAMLPAKNSVDCVPQKYICTKLVTHANGDLCQVACSKHHSVVSICSITSGLVHTRLGTDSSRAIEI